MFADLLILDILVQTPAGIRVNADPFEAWALLRENRGDFLVAPANEEPRIVATGRQAWAGWVELVTEPVDETATRMTARVVNEVPRTCCAWWRRRTGRPWSSSTPNCWAAGTAMAW